MDTVRIDLDGERQVGLRFDEFPDVLYDGLRAEVEALTGELLAAVQASAPERTGKLRSQVRARIFADKTKITGRVDIASANRQDLIKAAALEYGSRGRAAKISAHSMSLDHFWSLHLNAPIDVAVGAYSRTPNIAEHAFERGPLGAMQPEIIGRLNGVVENAVKEANS